MKHHASADILVTIAHPQGDVEVPLETWIQNGPGERRLLTLSSARSRDGHPLPLSVVPLRYRNNRLSRLLISIGLRCDPWQ